MSSAATGSLSHKARQCDRQHPHLPHTWGEDYGCMGVPEDSAASDSRGVHVPEGAGRPAAPGEGLPRASSAAQTPEGDTLRTALQGAMVGEWGRDNALAALASLERQNKQLRDEVQRLNKVIAYGVTR